MPTINNGGQYMQAITYTGTGSTQTINVGFQPDLVWIKQRNGTAYHALFDSVRGATKVIQSNTTTAEQTFSTALTAFTSNGFTTGSSTDTNQSGQSYVAWCWKAGTTSASNTDGTITSTVSVGATQGFSVVTYTSTTGTVGHGLGVAPSMIIMKPTNNTDQWTVGHVGLPSWNYGLALNATSAQDANSGFWNNTAPTSTVFSQGSWNSGFTKVAYCFAAVAGYSAFGSYTGNGSADGPFVYTGFRPKYVLIKRTDTTDNWLMEDTSRSTYNQTAASLYPNLSNAEDTGNPLDILSNGFKSRSASTTFNASSGTYIYACFAENPLKYALAR